MIPAIVLAGGAGTRLTSVVSEVPKPMAPVNGRPFLEIILDYLLDQGIRLAVLSVGHKREIIQAHFGNSWRGLQIRYCVETEPLGTGGALRKAMIETGLPRAFALNGDSYCPVSLTALSEAHDGADLTLTLKRVEDVGRFGAVERDARGRVIAFREKSSIFGPGLINAGVYVVEKTLFRVAPEGPFFSFETDLMQKHCASVFCNSLVTNEMFIDIGLPEDFQRAQEILM